METQVVDAVGNKLAVGDDVVIRLCTWRLTYATITRIGDKAGNFDGHITVKTPPQFNRGFKRPKHRVKPQYCLSLSAGAISQFQICKDLAQ